MSRVSLRNLCVLILAIVMAQPALARDPKPDSSLFDPATDSGRFMSVHDSETLLRGRWSMGFYLDYARKPISLVFRVDDGAGLISQTRFDVVSDQLNGTLVGALGATDWLTVGLSVPTTFWQVFYDPNARSAGGLSIAERAAIPSSTKAGLGDVRLEGKFRLLDIEQYGFGVSIVPHMVFPTGRRGSHISGERWTPGVTLAGETVINDRVWLAANLGYQFVHNSTNYFSDDTEAVIDDLLKVGLGARIKINEEWAILGEYLAETVVTQGAFSAGVRTPMEILGGAQWTPQKRSIRGLGVTAMVGTGFVRGVGAPQVHGILGVTYPTPKVVTAEPLQAVVEEKIIISQKVHFAYDSAKIRDISFPILNDVALLLKDNEQIAQVRVEGHTDSRGSDEYNQALSQRRANSVVDYLVAKGISADRLTPIGYGEAQPVADNESDEGRARNRRTEFTIVGN